MGRLRLGAAARLTMPRLNALRKLLGCLPAPGKRVVIAVSYLWLLVFFLAPFAVMLYISLVDQGENPTPFIPLWDASGPRIRLENYWSIVVNSHSGVWFDTIYLTAYAQSIGYALASALLCLAIGYPFAYAMARARPNHRAMLLLLVMLPFWTSFLLRIYAWKGLLADYGFINNLLRGAGLIDQPIPMLYNDAAILIGMTYVYLPFMVLPLYATLVRMDASLLEVARDLGASPLHAFRLVTLPLSRPGMVAGTMLVFIPCVGEFVIPSLLGGVDNLMIGRVVWDEMFTSNNWPRANALAIVMILLLVIPLICYYRMESARERRRA